MAKGGNKISRGKLGLPATVAAGALAAVVLPFLIWNVLSGFAAGYVFALMIALSLALLVIKRSFAPFMITYVLALASYAALSPVTIAQYDALRIELFREVNEGHELGWTAKMSIAGLNAAMGIAGYPFFPEASIETISLFFRIPGGRVRTNHSGFFLKSSLVSNAFAGLAPGKIKRVVWTRADYGADSKEARYALALNPCELWVDTVDGRLKYFARVRVEYPDRAEAVLIRQPFRLAVEEGLFGYLQRAGWLHPYDAVWVSD